MSRGLSRLELEIVRVLRAWDDGAGDHWRCLRILDVATQAPDMAAKMVSHMLTVRRGAR